MQLSDPLRPLTHIFWALALSILSTLAAEPTSTDPVPERLISLCDSKTPMGDDLAYLETLADSQTASTPLAKVLLFKLAPDKYRSQFETYFRIDGSKEKKVLTADETNQAVNSVLGEFKQRPPAEVVSRIYLKFRGSDLAFLKPDGTKINLEMMFRASVFAATKASQEEILQLAALADGKSLPKE